MERPLDWWRDAVIYQVYPRSFADADGDGMGDVPGIISRLDYIASLGVDAIWISPMYTSPLHDGGYDVADYRTLDARLGSVADMDALIAAAHERGLRIFLDLVPNHTSSEHTWFKEVLASEPGSRAWDRYIIREGKGADHELPPNNWRSVFHGPGWSRLPNPDGTPSPWWYLHLFDSTQPDLNWQNEEVRAEFRDILRFWFDRGIDGFRIDVAHGLAKQEGLPDYDYAEGDPALLGDQPHAPFWDQDEVHEIYREWRAVANEYDPPRVFCGETWVPNPERLARYQRPDELHTSFNFDYLQAGWDAGRMRRSIDDTIANHARIGAPPTWVLSNHDVVRHATRLAPGFDNDTRLTCVVDAERGLRRARAATVFTLTLPGSMYLYQGEELGLPEVTDLDPSQRQDPAWHRSGGTDGTRDGCRVPIPWSGDAPTYGFNAAGASWLPQPADWADLTVAAEDGDDESTLTMYREALRIRRAQPALGEGPLTWLTQDGELLALVRGTGSDAIISVLNMSDTSVTLPAQWGIEVLLGSNPDVAVLHGDEGDMLAIGGETAVWLTQP